MIGHVLTCATAGVLMAFGAWLAISEWKFHRQLEEDERKRQEPKPWRTWS